jgi:hypothetical protein
MMSYCRFSVIIGIMLACAAANAQDEHFATVSIAKWATGASPLRNFPKGLTHLAGVPFDLPTTGNNVWYTDDGNNWTTIQHSIPMNVFGARSVYTLINDSWGIPGPASYCYLLFTGSKGDTYRYDLVDGVHIRDWNNASWVNTVSSPLTTKNVVYENPDVYNVEGRQDMQQIDLPSSFALQDLVEVKLVDSGAYYQHRSFISGLTVFCKAPVMVLSGKAIPQEYTGPMPKVDFSLRQAGASEDIKGYQIAADGSFTIKTHFSGKFELVAKASHWLGVTSGVLDPSVDDLTNIQLSLPNGDVDGDNAVTVLDYNFLSSAFDSKPGDASWDERADLDGDGAVTVLDYNVLSSNFDRQGY